MARDSRSVSIRNQAIGKRPLREHGPHTVPGEENRGVGVSLEHWQIPKPLRDSQSEVIHRLILSSSRTIMPAGVTVHRRCTGDSPFNAAMLVVHQLFDAPLSRRDDPLEGCEFHRVEGRSCGINIRPGGCDESQNGRGRLFAAVDRFATGGTGRRLPRRRQADPCERCFSCHGAARQKAVLPLDTAVLIRQGGKSGPAIEPGKSDESLLIERVTAGAESTERMPPAGEGVALDDQQVKILRG